MWRHYSLEESVSQRRTLQVTQLFTYLLTHKLFSSCIRRCPVSLSRACNCVMSALSAVLLTLSSVCFLANVLHYVRYMLSAVRLLSVVCLLSVCLLSVTLVHPTQVVELFGNFFSPYDSPGTLLFWCQKSLVGDAPFPLKFSFIVTDPPFK